MIIFQAKNPMLTMANGLAQIIGASLSGSLGSGMGGGNPSGTDPNALLVDGTTDPLLADGTTNQLTHT